MASPAPGEQSPSVQTGRKRKRSTDDDDYKDETLQDVEPAAELYQNHDTDDDSDRSESPSDNDGSDYDPDGENEEQDEEDEEAAFVATLNEPNMEKATYYESSEAKPAHPVFDDVTPDIIKGIAAIPQRVLEQLPGVDPKTSLRLKCYLDSAEALRSVPSKVKLKIAMLGDAGVGKSSLLNAITHKEGLAKTGSIGESMTCVPTEYTGKCDGQKEDFAALIEYYEPAEARRVLERLVQDYNSFEFEERGEWDETELTEKQTARDEAERMFNIMFHNLPHFANKAATTACLKQNHDLLQTRSDTLLDELVLDYQNKLGQKYTKSFEARSAKKLQTQINALISSSSKRKGPVLWPLVRQVRISVGDSRVLDKATIVDLPGISDTNQVRVDLTHSFVKDCDYVWVVAPIKRVLDDHTVNHLLTTYGKPCNGRITLICTHSDDGTTGRQDGSAVEQYVEENLDDNELLPYRKCGEDMTRKRKQATQLQNKVQRAKKRSNATEAQKAKYRADSTKLKALKDDYRKLAVKRFETLIHLRNTIISTKARERFGVHLPEGTSLRVFCVSNQHYEMLNQRSPGWLRLSAAGTGIPELRAHTLMLHAPREFSLLESFAHARVPDLLADLALWANCKKFDPPPELLQYAGQLEEEFLNKLNGALERFEEIITGILEGAIKPAIPKAQVSAAKHLTKKFETFHWQTFMAFVRKNGKHKPPKSKKTMKDCWNEDFAKQLADAIWQCEPQLTQARKRLLEQIQKTLVKDTEEFKRAITNVKKGVPKVPLSHSIDTKLRVIEHTFASIGKECDEHVENVLMDLCRDSEENAFSKSMRSIYQSCAQDKNRKNITKRTFFRLEQHLSQKTNKSPFVLARKDIISKIVRAHKDRVGDCIKLCLRQTLGQLRASLKDLLDNNADASELAAKKEIRSVLPDLNSDLERGRKDLENLKKKYEI